MKKPLIANLLPKPTMRDYGPAFAPRRWICHGYGCGGSGETAEIAYERWLVNAERELRSTWKTRDALNMGWWKPLPQSLIYRQTLGRSH